VADTKIQLPEELRGRLPRIVEEFARRATVVVISMVSLGIPAMIMAKSQNLWRVISAGLGPLAATAYLLLRPFNPYQQSLYASLEGMESRDRTSGSPERRLAELLRSRQAARIAVFTGIVTALCFTA
jgi:hypothetical protein